MDKKQEANASMALEDMLEDDTLDQESEETEQSESTEDSSLANAEVPENQTFIKQEKTDKPYWYVVYTYSGYEMKVMTDLKKTIQNHHMQDTILEVQVPTEETIETRNGKRRHVARKKYPGYVMVKMFLTDESWYVVRNTRGVTGFVGPGSKPIPCLM